MNLAKLLHSDVSDENATIVIYPSVKMKTYALGFLETFTKILTLIRLIIFHIHLFNHSHANVHFVKQKFTNLNYLHIDRSDIQCSFYWEHFGTSLPRLQMSN